MTEEETRGGGLVGIGKKKKNTYVFGMRNEGNFRSHGHALGYGYGVFAAMFTAMFSALFTQP